MNIVLLTGSHPRHLYLAKVLNEAGLLKGLLIEQREQFVPHPAENLSTTDRANFIRHFRDRDEAEARFFKNVNEAELNIPIKRVEKEELNSDQVKQWVTSLQPDGVISYGVHKLSNDLLQEFPSLSWNIHGGLSPWYRGNITLFWPFYFLQPNWAGMTIHQLSSKIDAGEIVHHSVPTLEYGDGVHDVACKAVIQVTQDLVEILNFVKEEKSIKTVPQKSNGKLFVGEDWKPQHLRLIYQTFENDIVDRFLDGDIYSENPKLVNFFDLNELEESKE